MSPALSADGGRESRGASLGRRRSRLLRPLATPDDWHAPIGRGPTVRLCRLPGTRLSFEVLRPTPLNSVHDVAWQVQSSHVGNPCETNRLGWGRRATALGRILR